MPVIRDQKSVISDQEAKDIGKTSCKDLPSLPQNRGGRAVKPVPPRPRHVQNRTHPAPWHGKSNPFFTMSKITVGPKTIVANRRRSAKPVTSNGSRAKAFSRSLQHLRPSTLVLSAPRGALKAPGGARRDRTDDLLLAKQALSQLSYGPVRGQKSVVSCQEKSAPDH
jgi:hypothetical protein